MFRRKPAKVVEDDGDDGFSSAKLKVPEKQNNSRAELLSGRRGKGAVPNQEANGDSRSALDPNARFVHPDDDEHDPYSDNPLRRAELQELQEVADQKAKAVTDSVQNAVRIAEDTQNIAATTFVTLQEQGEQIRTIADKTIKLEKDLSRGEKLLNKLGPIFTPSWKTKKATKIKGATDDYLPSGVGSTGSDKARRNLGIDELKSKYKQDDSDLPSWEREKLKQDDGLDQISNALENMKNMAIGMGQEMNRQDKDLDTLADNMTELKSRVEQSNKRGRQILRRG